MSIINAKILKIKMLIFDDCIASIFLPKLGWMINLRIA